MSQGVLPSQTIAAMIANGQITATNDIPEPQIQHGES